MAYGGRGLCVLGFMLIAAATAAQGQSGASIGTLDATAHQDLPASIEVRIRKPDRSPASEEVARIFAAELAKRGHAVTDGGRGHTLSFRWTSEIEIDPEPYPMVELREHERNPSFDEEAEKLLRLGRRGVRASRSRSTSPPSVLFVELVDERAQLVWSARATVLISPENVIEMAGALVPPMFGQLGKSVYSHKLN